MSDTGREKLIEAAETEMLARGYPATTVDEICERAGVSKGSFYHHFSSKEELGLAVLDAYYRRNREILARAPSPGDDPRGHALALVDHLVESAGVLWGAGCLMGNFALELAETNAAMAAAVSDKFRGVEGMLVEGFAPLVPDGDEDARALAEQFIVTVEGALVLARAHGDWSYVERALERFRDSIHLSLGAET